MNLFEYLQDKMDESMNVQISIMKTGEKLTISFLPKPISEDTAIKNLHPVFTGNYLKTYTSTTTLFL